MKLLRHHLQLIELLLAHLAGLQQLLHLCLRVALKALPKLLELLHHLTKLSHRSGHFAAAQRVIQWV